MAWILYNGITLCLVFITIISSVPHQRGSLHMKNPNFEKVSTLTYQYLSRVTVSAPGGGSPRQLTTDCRVQVSSLTATKQRMKVSACSLTDSISEYNKKGDAAFTQLRHDLHKYDVIFVTTPGDSHVMIHHGETPVALNLKRAILSLLTSPKRATSGSLSSLQQTHRGECVVKATMTEDKNIHMTKTVIDLKSCTQSSKITQEFVTLYQPAAGEGLNWTGSEECSFAGRPSGQVEQIDCEEQLRVGSNSHGVSLHVHTSRSLTLVSASPTTHQALPVNRYIRSSLHHTFVPKSQTPPSNSNDVLQAIHHLQEVSQSARARPVTEQTTFHLRRLRSNLARLGRESLMRLVSDVLGSDVTNYDDVTQGLLVDAIAACGTETCVTVILTSPIPIHHHVRFLRAMTLGQTPSQRILAVIKEACTSLLAEHCTLPLSILNSRSLSSRAGRTPDQETVMKAARGLLGDLLSSSESSTPSSNTWAHYLPLVSGVIITSTGIPVNFAMDSAIVVSADASRTTVESSMNGKSAFSVEADIVTSIQLGWSGSVQSGVERSSSWRAHIDSQLRLTTDGQLSLTMDNLAPSHPIQTRTTTYMNIDGQLNEALPQSQWCLWRPLDWVTGTNLCHSHGDSATQYPGVWTSLSNGMEELLGISVKDVVLGNGRQLSIKLPIASPVHAHRSARSVVDRVVTAWDGSTPTYTAMVMGENHIVTWDGTAYTLPDYRTRRCAYQLARDVRKHNFTLLQTRHMVELLTKDVAVRIRHDGQVLIDRASTPSGLPYRSTNGHVVVTRRSSNVQVMTTFGINLQYNTKTQNTVFTLSSSYFNHSRGLLGINDGLRHHGYVTRQGHVTHSVYDAVRSYEVSSRPECHPEVDSPDLRHSAPLCNNGLDAHCDEFFHHNSSPLSSCFGRVDPTTFKTTCQREARRCYRSTARALNSVCRVAAAYTDLCQSKGVSLQTPTVCAGCGHHQVGASWTQHIGHKMDTVVVVPTGTSHRNVIAPIINILSSALKTGSTPYDLRVGVITVPEAGQFTNANSLTFNGALFSHNPQEEVISAAEQLPHQMGTSGSSPHQLSDLDEGLHLAATYPYRPNAIKLILLITDSDSVQDDTSSLTSLLNARGIIVDVVSPYESLRPESVAGLLQSGELLTSHGRSIAQQLPQTRYAQVALQSGGILLDPQALTGTTRTLVARALTTQAHHQRRLCRRCTCQAGNEGFSVCHKVTC